MEEKIIAVNDTALEKKDFLEWIYALFGKSVKIATGVVFVCVSLIYLIEIISLITKTVLVSKTIVIWMTVCLLVAILFGIVLPRFWANGRYKQYKETRKSDSKITFFENYLETSSGGKVLNSIQYKDLVKKISSKNLCIYQTNKRMYCVFRKDGFSSGTLADVQAKVQI